MIALADTGRLTSSLGFGSSGLMAGDLGEAASLALLECAYEAGIRHFDVAPMYGLGAAEACLGTFLSRHPQDTTVTTKFGIAPPEHRVLLNLARSLGRPIVQRFPSLKKRLVKGTQAVMPSGTPVPFTAKEARVSLHASLRNLRLDRIDVWLLHEASAEDLRDDGLLLFLDEAKAAGKVGSFGIGSDRSKIPALVQERAAYCGVVQFDWSVLDAPLPKMSGFQIRHRSLTDGFKSIHSALTHNAALCRRWSDATGRDLGNASELASLMLKAALECNPDGIILFSSKDPSHIIRNARTADDAALASPSLILHELIQTEGLTVG